MGPQAAVNAVYYNRLKAIADPAERERTAANLRAEYAREIDLVRLASELVVDAVVAPAELREELVRRLAAARSKRRDWPAKHNPVTPV